MSGKGENNSRYFTELKEKPKKVCPSEWQGTELCNLSVTYYILLWVCCWQEGSAHMSVCLLVAWPGLQVIETSNPKNCEYSHSIQSHFHNQQKWRMRMRKMRLRLMLIWWNAAEYVILLYYLYQDNSNLSSVEKIQSPLLNVSRITGAPKYAENSIQ